MEDVNRFAGAVRSFADLSLVRRFFEVMTRTGLLNWLFGLLRIVSFFIFLFFLANLAGDVLATLLPRFRQRVIFHADVPSTQQFKDAEAFKDKVDKDSPWEHYLPFFGTGIEDVDVMASNGTQDNLRRLIESQTAKNAPPTCAIVVDAFAAQDSTSLRMLAPYRTEMFLVVAKKSLLKRLDLKGAAGRAATFAEVFQYLATARADEKALSGKKPPLVELAVGNENTLQRRMAGELLELVCPPKAGEKAELMGPGKDKTAYLAGLHGFKIKTENPDYAFDKPENVNADPEQRLATFADIAFLSTNLDGRLVKDMAASGEWEALDCASVLGGFIKTRDGYAPLSLDAVTFGQPRIPDGMRTVELTPSTSHPPGDRLRPFIPSAIKVLTLRKVLACGSALDTMTAQQLAIAASSAWSKNIDVSTKQIDASIQKEGGAIPSDQRYKPVLQMHPAVESLKNGNPQSEWWAALGRAPLYFSLITTFLVSAPISQFFGSRLDGYLRSINDAESRKEWESLRKTIESSPKASSAVEALQVLVDGLKSGKLSGVLNPDCHPSMRGLQAEVIEALTRSIERWGKLESSIARRGCKQIFSDVVALADDMGDLEDKERDKSGTNADIEPERRRFNIEARKLINSIHQNSDKAHTRINATLDLIKSLPAFSVTPGLRRLDTICEELLLWIAAKLRRNAQQYPKNRTSDHIVEKLASDMSHAMSQFRKELPAKTIQSMPDPLETWKDARIGSRRGDNEPRSCYGRLKKEVDKATTTAKSLSGKKLGIFIASDLTALRTEIKRSYARGVLTRLRREKLLEPLKEYLGDDKSPKKKTNAAPESDAEEKRKPEAGDTNHNAQYRRLLKRVRNAIDKAKSLPTNEAREGLLKKASLKLTEEIWQSHAAGMITIQEKSNLLDQLYDYFVEVVKGDGGNPPNPAPFGGNPKGGEPFVPESSEKAPPASNAPVSDLPDEKL